MREARITALILVWLAMVIFTYGMTLTFHLQAWPLSHQGKIGCRSAEGSSALMSLMAPVSTAFIGAISGGAAYGVHFSCAAARSAIERADMAH